MKSYKEVRLDLCLINVDIIYKAFLFRGWGRHTGQPPHLKAPQLNNTASTRKRT